MMQGTQHPEASAWHSLLRLDSAQASQNATPQLHTRFPHVVISPLPVVHRAAHGHAGQAVRRHCVCLQAGEGERLLVPAALLQSNLGLLSLQR